jgi:hypothetical protein
VAGLGKALIKVHRAPAARGASAAARQKQLVDSDRARRYAVLFLFGGEIGIRSTVILSY